MSTAMPTEEPGTSPAAIDPDEPLADPEIRRFLVDFVRRRVPASDVEDVVQTVLLDALAAESRPTERGELRRWLAGIARHKAADAHRRGGREVVSEPVDVETGPAPLEARALATWAEEQASSVRDAGETLRWMAREGEGEKLETIAAEANVPAARVRQRVSRMRRWMKERWMAELALVAALALAALVAYSLLRKPREVPEAVVPEVPSALPPEAPTLDRERARALRAEAFERCDRSDWTGCLDDLDRAAALDPEGERDPIVAASRERAKAALAPPPAPTSAAPPPPQAPTAAPPSPAPKATPSPDDEKKKLERPRTKAAPEAPSTKPAPTAKSAPSSLGGPFDALSGGGSDGPPANAPFPKKPVGPSKKGTQLDLKK
jgi:DNA-directed RNA polymerase specialized sigma24 family protein